MEVCIFKYFINILPNNIFLLWNASSVIQNLEISVIIYNNVVFIGAYVLFALDGVLIRPTPHD